MNKFVFVWILLSSAIPYSVFAVDLDELESIVSNQLCMENNCKFRCEDELKMESERLLPDDADTCNAKEQRQLLTKGLYKTKDGQVLSLKKEFKTLASKNKIDVPEIRREPVLDKATPYVIDLQSDFQLNTKELSEKNVQKDTYKRTDKKQLE